MAKKFYFKGEEYSFTAVKGNAETDYRSGDVNITPDNIGLGNVDNTADKDKSVKYATSAGSANSVDWSKVQNKPSSYAPSSHTHGNADITAIDASKITSGTIDIERLPQGALDRLVRVADDTARFKLTTDEVQLGDTVQTLDNKKMYYVVDETKLSTEDGYSAYTADTATSVPWSGVTGKPSSYTPSSHTHDDRYYTETEIDTKLAGKVDNSSTGADTLLSNITATWTATPTDDTNFIRQDTGGGNVFGRVKFSTLWSYIKGKADKVYSALGHKHTKSEITDFPTSMAANGGNSATVNGHTVNSDVPANAKFTDTTYTSKAAVTGGTDVSLVTTGEKAAWNAKTSSSGTITGITMNGASKGTSGVIDLGTVLTGGKQTTTSTADGGSNVYTFSDNSTITIKNGSKGSAGSNGTSAVWFTGTAVTGTATSATAFTVSGSKAGDMYLNTSTYNVYRASAANSWVYVCNIKGATGSSGTNGTTPTIKAAAGSNIGSVGTPSVTASTSGTTTTFTFNNLKGAKGDPGTNATTTATGTASAAGLTKLYTGTGTATDGTMTQNAIKSALDGKANNSRYYFSNNNVYRCLGTATLRQSGDYLLLRICCGAGYNAVISQDRVIDVHLRTSNGSSASDSKYYAGYIESHLNGATNCNVYVVQNSTTSFSIWIGKLSYPGNSFYDVYFPSGASWSSSTNTSESIPTNGVALTEKCIAYTDSSITGNAATATNATKVNNHTVNADVPSGAKFTDTVYTHPTTAGNKHIPSGGSAGQILKWSASGTAVWGNETGGVGQVIATAEPTGQKSGDHWLKEF